MSHSGVHIFPTANGHTQQKKLSIRFFFWRFDGQIYIASYRTNSFKFKRTSTSSSSRKTVSAFQIKHHTQTNGVLCLWPFFFSLSTIFNLKVGSLCAHAFFSVSSDGFLGKFSIQHYFLFVAFESRSLSLLSFVPSCSQSAFVFIIECALDWFMERPTNLKYESSFGFR